MAEEGPAQPASLQAWRMMAKVQELFAYKNGRSFYGPVLKRRYVSDYSTDFDISNALFSLGTVSSFHLLRALSQEVPFMVKIVSEEGRR